MWAVTKTIWSIIYNVRQIVFNAFWPMHVLLCVYVCSFASNMTVYIIIRDNIQFNK
jgi:hypothetical protein